MIIITGATGQLGGQIVRDLLRRVPAERVGASVRDPALAGQLQELGVRVRRGDFTDPDSLRHAFEAATRVLIISCNETGERAVAQHRAATDAAVAAGATHILYTSHQAASPGSLFAPMPDHAATEQYLAGVVAPSTALRNGFYASTISQLIGRALDTGELVAPADGPVSWTARADLAEAAAILLAGEVLPTGPTEPLTADRALDLADIASMLTERTGRTVRRVVVDDDEWREGLVGHGVPATQATMLSGMFHASRRGEFAAVSPALGELLGRPLLGVEAILDAIVARR